MANYIIGTKFAGHDTNVAVVDDTGRIVMAVEEERFDRVKHSTNFPLLALREAVERYGVRPEEVAYVATPFCHELFYDRINVVKDYFEAHKGFDEARHRSLVAYEYDYLDQYLHGALYLQEMFPRATLIDVRHHLTHAASAFYCSPFEEAAILSVDANGEIETTMLGQGCGSRIKELETIAFPHTLGFLYEYVSEWLGLGRLEGPGKTMGLASYGTPRYLDVFRDKLFELDEAHGTFRINPALVSDSPPPLLNTGYLTEVFGREGRMADTTRFDQFQADIAASLQALAEEAVLLLARRLKKLTGARKLCIAGGVALNCMANGRIHRSGLFEDIFIQPAANDGGAGLGAALYAYYNHLKPGAARTTAFHPYTGTAWSAAEIEAAIEAAGLPVRRPESIEQWTAEKLAEGWLIGWFQGGMELGPRALGNRSILADPTKAENKDLLNARIKYREWWRPFAPVVLYEHAREYFDLEIEAPYMLIIGGVLNDRLPAISHIDRTARVQTLRRDQNPRVYDLIAHFQKLTGVPVILNTSFNVRGEPLIRTPAEALNCLFRGGLDAVVMGECAVLQSDLDPARHRPQDASHDEARAASDDYRRFVERKRQEIREQAASLDGIVPGTGAEARLLCIEALKADKRVESFQRGGRPYLDTLGRQTIFGRRVTR